ncbi:XdhC family protein [Pseudomonas sp. LJDD11]|uniref:XdhC family protein n=1 Tax=Pseudomonas sp. LJDD11 TaxID=2931984 RepID=UPI00211BDAAF|nr:XdhC family protein [Pseudomonas sp. LJDD11]MCQ9424866.1 XdhC family protein [Pseudomonas sp. LJDD11]
MESVDLLVLRTASGWLAEGRRVLLATVVRTWGSSPRPVGSMMALRDDGRTAGSVSGGCIEDDLIHRYSAAFSTQPMPVGAPQVVRYGVSADEAHRFGLPCGGTLELVLEFEPDQASLAHLLAALDDGVLMRRTLGMATGDVTLVPANQPEALQFDGATLINTLGPAYRMLLIGAGALAEYLATMALFSGFRVTVCDPRHEYRAGWSVAGAELVTGMPDDEVLAFRPDVRSCVIGLTHDPKLDDLALLAALDSPAFYVGAIGSRRNDRSRRDRLIEHFGQSEASLQRLHGPVGIFIGSKTPAEIAVSIMAQVLAIKNGVRLPDTLSVAHGKQQLERNTTDAA